MRDFKVGTLGRARVWVDEEAGARYSTTTTIERTIPVRPTVPGTCDTRRIAVELLLPRGARCEYGLLGGCVRQNGSASLVFRVHVSTAAGEAFHGALAGAVDQVRIGLPEEYAVTIIDLGQGLASSHLTGGVLTIDEAAHGLVGSSPRFFARLVTIVVGLLDPCVSLSEELIERKVVEEALRR